MRQPTLTGSVAFALMACAEVEVEEDPETDPSPAPIASPRIGENGVDWNGIDWNGIDWNGVDWNGIDWNGVDWNGIDWNGIQAASVDWPGIDWRSQTATGASWPAVGWTASAAATDWNHVDWTALDWNAPAWSALDWGAVDWPAIDWTAVEIRGVWGDAGGVVTVHPDARPMFLFVRAAYAGTEFPLAIPGPGALRMLATAPDPDAVLYFLRKAWQVAYGPGFHMFAGFYPTAVGGTPVPAVAEGHFGLAPSLAGFGPYAEPQIRAWTSMIGNLLNDQPLQISLRAADVDALSSTSYEIAQYGAVDVRAAMGRLVPPPWDPTAQPLVVLMRSRVHMFRDQLGMRGACPLDGYRMRSCAGGQVWAVDLTQPGHDLGCSDVLATGPYQGSVAGMCWVDLPGIGWVEQKAAEVPMVASFVWAGLPQPPP